MGLAAPLSQSLNFHSPWEGSGVSSPLSKEGLDALGLRNLTWSQFATVELFG
jgi:hypothetical protein